jgi:hypothetical protein
VRELQAGVGAGQYNERFVEAFLDITPHPSPIFPAARRPPV